LTRRPTRKHSEFSLPESNVFRGQGPSHFENVRAILEIPPRTIAKNGLAGVLVDIDASDRLEPSVLEAQVKPTGPCEGRKNGQRRSGDACHESNNNAMETQTGQDSINDRFQSAKPIRVVEW
jgi:hypothetical protein